MTEAVEETKKDEEVQQPADAGAGAQDPAPANQEAAAAGDAGDPDTTDQK